MNLYTAAITLILVMDPLGNIPVFLSFLREFDAKKRRKIIIRETAIAFVILSVFLFFGRYILHGLHITTPAVSIAGGIILFMISIKMIFPQPKELSEHVIEEPLIVPLAIPLTAGPSALATVILFATQDPSKIWWWFLAVVIATTVFLIIMLSSGFLMNVLRRRGLVAMERLMGMILTTVSVQMFLSGIGHYFNLG